VQSAEQVNAANAKGAQLFKPGGTNTFEIMHMAVDTDLAYWVGIRRSVVNMRGSRFKRPHGSSGHRDFSPRRSGVETYSQTR